MGGAICSRIGAGICRSGCVNKNKIPVWCILFLSETQELLELYVETYASPRNVISIPKLNDMVLKERDRVCHREGDRAGGSIFRCVSDNYPAMNYEYKSSDVRSTHA